MFNLFDLKNVFYTFFQIWLDDSLRVSNERKLYVDSKNAIPFGYSSKIINVYVKFFLLDQWPFYSQSFTATRSFASAALILLFLRKDHFPNFGLDYIKLFRPPYINVFRMKVFLSKPLLHCILYISQSIFSIFKEL